MINNKKKVFDNRMLFQCLLIYLGICAGLWVNNYIFLVVSLFTLIVSVIARPQDVYYHLFFTLPFTLVYKMNPASTSLFAYVMIFSGFILILRVKRFAKESLIYIIIFTFYIFLGMGTNVTFVIKLIIGMFLFYIFVDIIDRDEFKNQIMAFSLGMVGSSFIGLLKGSWNRIDIFFSDLNSINIDGEVTYRFSGLYRDPNYYSISAIFAICLCLFLLINSEGNRIMELSIILMLSIFGFISYSKMFLLVYIILLLFFVLSKIKSAKEILFSFVSIALFYGGFYFWNNKSGYLNVMTNRMTSGDISTGRFDIWLNYFSYITQSLKNIFFGKGVGSSYYEGVAPHSTYVELIYYIGIMGILLMIFMILSIGKHKKICYRHRPLNYVLLLLFIIMISSLGIFMMNDMFFYCMMIWMSINFQFDKMSKET